MAAAAPPSLAPASRSTTLMAGRAVTAARGGRTGAAGAGDGETVAGVMPRGWLLPGGGQRCEGEAWSRRCCMVRPSRPSHRSRPQRPTAADAAGAACAAAADAPSALYIHARISGGDGGRGSRAGVRTTAFPLCLPTTGGSYPPRAPQNPTAPPTTPAFRPPPQTPRQPPAPPTRARSHAGVPSSAAGSAPAPPSSSAASLPSSPFRVAPPPSSPSRHT